MQTHYSHSEQREREHTCRYFFFTGIKIKVLPHGSLSETEDTKHKPKQPKTLLPYLTASASSICEKVWCKVVLSAVSECSVCVACVSVCVLSKRSEHTLQSFSPHWVSLEPRARRNKQLKTQCVCVYVCV